MREAISAREPGEDRVMGDKLEHDIGVSEGKITAIRISDLLMAIRQINHIAWHSEREGSPPLSNSDRWKIVNLCRDAIAKAEGRTP